MMDEKRKVYNLESFTDEERERMEALINQIEEEKKNKKKWWIMPNFDVFERCNPSIKLNYFVEEQKDFYSKSRPPLNFGFNSKEEAEEWLKDYLEKESLFKSAKDDVDNLVYNLGHIVEKLQKHECVTRDDWDNCFRLFDNSLGNGALSKVTKEE